MLLNNNCFLLFLQVSCSMNGHKEESFNFHHCIWMEKNEFVNYAFFNHLFNKLFILFLSSDNLISFTFSTTLFFIFYYCNQFLFINLRSSTIAFASSTLIFLYIFFCYLVAWFLKLNKRRINWFSVLFISKQPVNLHKSIT